MPHEAERFRYQPVEPDPDDTGGGNVVFQNIVGWCAVVTSTVCLLPQIVQAIRSRSTRDLSLSMLFLFLASAGSWVLYGSLIGDWAVVTTNVIAGCCSFFLLALKLLYDAEKGLSKKRNKDLCS